MKKLLITTLLSVMLTTPGMATESAGGQITDICTVNAKLARLIMTFRQRDVSQDSIIVAMKQYTNNDSVMTKLANEMVNKAYLHKIYSNDSDKKNIINLFGNLFFYECLNTMYSN